MDGKEMKQKLTELFGEQIRFNKEFEPYVDLLKEGMQEEFYGWCVQCKEGIALGSVPPRRQYKNLFVFFRKIGNTLRGVLIKEQNNGFIEIVLDSHEEYDK